MELVGSTGFRQCRFQFAAGSAEILWGFPMTIVNGGLKLGFDFANAFSPALGKGISVPQRGEIQLLAAALAF